MPCLRVYATSGIRVHDPLITSREHEPLHHSAPVKGRLYAFTSFPSELISVFRTASLCSPLKESGHRMFGTNNYNDYKYCIRVMIYIIYINLYEPHSGTAPRLAQTMYRGGGGKALFTYNACPPPPNPNLIVWSNLKPRLTALYLR